MPVDRTIPELYVDNPVVPAAGVKIVVADASDNAGAMLTTTLLTTSANEINALATKATVVGADKIVIEDSAASWAKKGALVSGVNGCAMACATSRTNFTPSAATVDGNFTGIDNALANAANGAVRHDANGDASIVRDLAVARNVAIEGDFVVNPLGVGGVNAATIDNDTGNFTHAGTLSTAGGNFTIDASGNVTNLGTVDYDNTASGLAASDIKAAIDELASVSLTSAVHQVRACDYGAATAANVDLSTALDNGSTFDGLTLATGDVVVLGSQTDASENGAWVVAASGAPARPAWFPVGGSAAKVLFFVTEGTWVGKVFRCTNAVGADVIGTNNLALWWAYAPMVSTGGAGLPGTVLGDNITDGVVPGTVAVDSDVGRAWVAAVIDDGSIDWRALGSRIRALGTSTFSINALDDGCVCEWTGTSTGIAGTVNAGRAGQVTTLLLTGIAGTITLTAGTASLIYEKGTSLTTLAPASGECVTVSLIYRTATTVAVTGGLA